MCLLHFKTPEQGDQGRLEQAVNSLQLKFAKKEALTENMKEMVLRPFAVECGLEAETAFGLLDAYFKKNHRHFYHFTQTNERIQQLTLHVQQIVPTHMLHQQQRQENYEAYHKELSKVAGRILSAVKAFYLQERFNLLRCVSVLQKITSRSQAASPVRDKLLNKDLPNNLAKSLLRSQGGDRHEFRRFFDSDSSQASRERLAFALQAEQIEILSLLFSILF